MSTSIPPGPKVNIPKSDSTVVRTSARGPMSPKTIELGRQFLAALFMGLRTAQIHDSTNKAFERGVQSVRVAADQLFSATGGFSINFVDESAFLNGTRLRFDGGAFDAMRTLRHILESKELGGIEMRAPPSYDAIRKLVLLFSTSPSPNEVVTKEDLLAMQIGVLGVQRFADASRDNLRVDRRVFAVQCYAKLLLAFREQIEVARGGARQHHAPRLRAVRVVQDLVELAGDRVDFLLRLGSNHSGAQVDDLHAVNTAVISVALGHALGLQRQDLVDIGVSALFHDVGRSEAVEPAPVPHPNVPVLGTEEAPIAYDGELLLAEEPEEAPLVAPAEDDDVEPEPLPVEYLGELAVVDPADRESPLDPAEMPLDPAERTVERPAPMGEFSLDEDPDADTGEHTPAREAPPRLDSSLLEPVPLDDSLLGLVPGGDTVMQYVGPYHPAEPPAPSAPAEGAPGHAEEMPGASEHPHTYATYARLLTVGGLSRNGLMRAVVAAEHHNFARERFAWGEARRRSHLFSRIVAVADAYDALTSGLGTGSGHAMHPLDALELMINDASGRLDQRIVDLLINVLRAFPVGTMVALDNGDRAVVTSHAGGTRWDRPVVRTFSAEARTIDLMTKQGDRLSGRILGTLRFLGEIAAEGSDDEPPPEDTQVT